MEQIVDILEIKDKLNKYVQDTAFTDFDKI